MAKIISYAVSNNSSKFNHDHCLIYLLTYFLTIVGATRSIRSVWGRSVAPSIQTSSDPVRPVLTKS